MTHTLVLRLDLDTGSSDFWVFSTLLKKLELDKAKEKHVVFDAEKSRTWHWPSIHWGGSSRPFPFDASIWNGTWSTEMGHRRPVS